MIIQRKSGATMNVKGFTHWSDKHGVHLKSVAKAGGVTNSSRVRTGYASVFGNLDSHSDILMPGAFASAVAEFRAGASRCKYLWQHNPDQPPTARILSIEELSASEMPNQLKIQNIGSGISGCLRVTREYLPGAFADSVLAAVDACGMELSFGFNLAEGDAEFKTVGDRRIRLIKNVSFLLDLSDVAWGSNPATFNDPLGLEAGKVSAVTSASKRDYLSEARFKMRKLELLSLGIDV